MCTHMCAEPCDAKTFFGEQVLALSDEPEFCLRPDGLFVLHELYDHSECCESGDASSVTSLFSLSAEPVADEILDRICPLKLLMRFFA